MSGTFSLINISNEINIEPINYKAFFEYNPNNFKSNKNCFNGLFVNKNKNDGFDFSCVLFSNSDFIKQICNYLENFFESKSIFNVYVLNYLNPCLENTFDKISHYQVNHYEANVLVDCISTAINRYIIKEDGVGDIITKGFKYLVNNKFRKIPLNICYSETEKADSDSYITLTIGLFNTLFEEVFINMPLHIFEKKNFEIIREIDFNVDTLDAYAYKLKEIVSLALVHYLFRKTCDYIRSEVNVYASMIVSDVAQYYNSVSNTFYDILNKIKNNAEYKTLEADKISEFNGISEKPLKNITNNKDLTESLEKFIAEKYSNFYSIIGLTETLTRSSQNKLANVESPAVELNQKIFQPMMVIIENMYNKFYYSFYEKYIINGFKDEKLFKDCNLAMTKYISIIRSYYNEKDMIDELSVYKEFPTPTLFNEYENEKIFSSGMDISDSVFNKIINNSFFYSKNKYESIYGSKFEELKNDINETFKAIFEYSSRIIKYEIMFKGKVNEWCSYLIKKANEHVTFDVIEDCKNVMNVEYSSLNHNIIYGLINKYHGKNIKI